MSGFIFGLIASLLAVGTFILRIADKKANAAAIELLQNNHIEHLKSDYIKLEKKTDLNEHNISKIFTELKGATTELKLMREQCLKNHK